MKKQYIDYKNGFLIFITYDDDYIFQIPLEVLVRSGKTSVVFTATVNVSTEPESYLLTTEGKLSEELLDKMETTVQQSIKEFVRVHYS